MNELEKLIKSGFDATINQIKADFSENGAVFNDGIKPVIDLLLALGFYIYQSGFENGMIYKENNESKNIQ